MDGGNLVKNNLIELDMPARVLHAYQIYLTNHSATKTAEIVGVDRSTIYRWRQTYEWDRLQESAFQAIVDTTADYQMQSRKMQREIINELVAKIEEEIENGKLEIRTIPELIALFKYQLELEGERFSTQSVDVDVGINIASLHEEIAARRLSRGEGNL